MTESDIVVPSPPPPRHDSMNDSNTIQPPTPTPTQQQSEQPPPSEANDRINQDGVKKEENQLEEEEEEEEEEEIVDSTAVNENEIVQSNTNTNTNDVLIMNGDNLSSSSSSIERTEEVEVQVVESVGSQEDRIAAISNNNSSKNESKASKGSGSGEEKRRLVSSGTSSSSSSSSTVKAASQMAAVAMAASSLGSTSHEKVAEYARGITATLSKIRTPVNVNQVCSYIDPPTALAAPLIYFTQHIPTTATTATKEEEAQQVALQIQETLLPQIQSTYQQLVAQQPTSPTKPPTTQDATAQFFQACSIPSSSSPPTTTTTTTTVEEKSSKVVSNLVHSVTSLVGKKKNSSKTDLLQQTDDDDDYNTNTSNYNSSSSNSGEYSVVIEREMLGLTVENVLERTVVRTVLAGGAAKKSGAKVGSLIVQVGSSSTQNLTHFETIDELRQSQRPLKLKLKKLSKSSLKEAREEMGRLIRGGGFGLLHTIDTPFLNNNNHNNNHNNNTPHHPTRTVLVKILLLLIYGLEQEGQMADAKSVAKILFDYLQPPPAQTPTPANVNVNKKKTTNNQNIINNNNNLVNVNPERVALLKLGDVLHRTRSFLADPLSHPASLLHGDVICLLCDVLDMDTDMVLAEEESSSTSIHHKSNKGVGDLGSAGSLLKLILLHLCEHGNGNRFLAVVHRLAASRSMAARVTACSLGPVLWCHLDFCYQLQLRGVLTRALHDVEVMVRKSTAAVLHEIAELVFDARVVPWLVLMCERAMTDPEPQLRAAAMTFAWHLAEHLPNAFDGDASQGSIRIQRLPSRDDPTFAPIYLLQCKLLPVATRLGEDRSPMVRISVAAQCDRLASALGCHWFSVLIDLLLALLADTEEAVRSEACLCLPRFVETVMLGQTSPTKNNSTVLESTLPVARKLLKDPSSTVRISLATACGELLTLLVGLQQCDLHHEDDNTSTNTTTTNTTNTNNNNNSQHHLDDMLIPSLQTLLHDVDPEVTSSALRAITHASRGNVREIPSTPPRHANRNNINRSRTWSSTSIETTDSQHTNNTNNPVFIPVLSEEQVLRLLPTLKDLSQSRQWRVRQSAVEIVPALLGCTHLQSTKMEIALMIFTILKEDTVDAVRTTAAECLCGYPDDNWQTSIVLPQLRLLATSPLSKQRLLSIKMMHVLTPQHTLVILDLLQSSLYRDPIVNVRLAVGRLLGHMIMTTTHHQHLEQMQRICHNLLDYELQPNPQKRPPDRDVLYYAQQALQTLTDDDDDDDPPQQATI